MQILVGRVMKGDVQESSPRKWSPVKCHILNAPFRKGQSWVITWDNTRVEFDFIFI